MSKVLVLRLAGPMQSWGSSSRFTRRSTEAFPTKSGIVGLLAAAQGRRRTDPIEDLANLRMAARVDQPGELLRDFQTAHREGESMPLSERFYRADAVFAAFVEGPVELIEGLAEALRRPVFPLYLGRRSCPPTMPLFLQVHEGRAWEIITQLPWQAARFWQQQKKWEEHISLRVVADKGILPDDEPSSSSHSLQDVPVSFDSTRRLYGLRSVDETRVTVRNPQYEKPKESPAPVSGGHDPMAVI